VVQPFVTLLTRNRNWLYPEADEFSLHPKTYFHEIYLNIIFLSALRSSRYLFPSGVPARPLHTLLISIVLAAFPTHLILFDFYHFNNIWRSMNYGVPHFVFFPHSCRFISFSTLFSDTINLCSLETQCFAPPLQDSGLFEKVAALWHGVY
jgi:hypothetical protein